MPVTKTIPASLTLSGTLDIEAKSVKAEDGEEKTIPVLSMVANTGKPMRLNGFMDLVVIDMAGAKFDKTKTPVLMDHDTSKRIGYTTEQNIEATRITAKALAMSSMAIAAGVVEDAKNGFPFQVSVGADIVKGYFVEEGGSTTVNGKTWKGPLIVASKTLIRELTLTVLGADNQTSATIAATRKGRSMSFEEYVASLGLDLEAMDADQTAKVKAQWQRLSDLEAGRNTNPPTPSPAPKTPDPQPTPDDDQLRRKRIAAEEVRVDSIRATADRYATRITGEIELADKTKTTVPKLKATAIEEGWDADRLELILLRASRDEDGPPRGPAVHVAQTVRDLGSEVISAALVRQSGAVPRKKTHDASGDEYGWEVDYKPEILEASDHRSLKNLSLHQIMDLFIIQASGIPYSGNRKSDDFIHATREAMRKLQASGFTTLSATNIFDDAANKLLWAGYQSVNTTWQEWAKTVNVSDFKTQNVYRMTHKGAYQQVGADGELKHGGFADSKYTVAADTYGKIVGLTRKHLINDDLGAFNTMMTALGVEGAKSLEEVCYVTLLNQVGTMWTAGNNNLSTGAGSDLTIAGLSAAQQLFEDQVDVDNAPLMIEPDRILVGTQDRIQAGQLFNDSEVREGPSSTSTKKEFTRNPHTSAYRPIVSGYLNNTNILQRVDSIGSAIPNQNSNQWFMFPNPNIPQGASFMVALLNGNRIPFLESADADFSVLGMQWRAYHDFGVDEGDEKLSVRSAGT